MNNHSQLREEFYKTFEIGATPSLRQVADWWLSKFSDHTKALVEKVEEIKREIITDGILDRSINNAHSYGYNQAIDDVKRLIQE